MAGHCLHLYLVPELTQAIAELQVKDHTGDLYAGLKALTKGLCELGVLDSEVANVLMKRYSQPKGSDINLPRNMEDKMEIEAQKKLEHEFSNVLKCWPTLKDKAKAYWVKEANAHSDLTKAKMILELAGEKNVS